MHEAERGSDARGSLRILNSWKEISAFLDRGVRTLQRWERDHRMPVHRIGDGPRSPVFAIPSELQAWILEITRRQVGPRLDKRELSGLMPDGTALQRSEAANSRSHELARRLIQLTAEHQKRAQELQSGLTKLTSQLSHLTKKSKRKQLSPPEKRRNNS